MTDAAGLPLTVYVAVSADGGASFNVPVFTLTGAVGPGVAAGLNRQIVWNAGMDWPGQFTRQCQVKILADDGAAPAAMAFIPASYFNMGDALDGENDAPVHTVSVSAFYMDRTLVTFATWTPIYQWATANGYGFDNGGSAHGPDHPEQTLNWFDAVKWCNARSQHDGLTPAYYTDAGLTAPYTNGQAAPFVKWSANGYRLPTEAEWEKAARGGLSGKRFPWGDTISRSQANYISQPSNYSYDLGPAGSIGNTTPVNSYAPNGYGLYDMAGNVWEWCWDWYDSSYYNSGQALDPHGPASGRYRVRRGGAWYGVAYYARCAYRGGNYPSYAFDAVGFRCVRGF